MMAQTMLLKQTIRLIIKQWMARGILPAKKFTYTLLQPLPQEGEDLKENVTLKEYLTWAFRFTLALAGFLAVMMIVIGEWNTLSAEPMNLQEATPRKESITPFPAWCWRWFLIWFFTPSIRVWLILTIISFLKRKRQQVLKNNP